MTSLFAIKENIKTQRPWDLSELFPCAGIENELQGITTLADEFATFEKELREDMSTEMFTDILNKREALSKRCRKIDEYVFMKYSENTTDAAAGAQRTKVMSEMAKIENKTLFFSLWFKKISDAAANRLLAVAGDQKYALEHSRKLRQHALSEKEEKIIVLKDITGASALNNVYDVLTSKFEFVVDGKMMTEEQVISLFRSPEQETRHKAYRALLTKFKDNHEVIGEIYKNLVLDWKQECCDVRGYQSPIEVRNKANDIPNAAVDALLDVCKENAHLFQRFFEVKRRALGLDKMHRFDLYAPVALKEEENVPYELAVQTVMETFADFSPKFAECAASVLNADHVHSTVQKGKRSGAYCTSAGPDVVPYVLLSYTGKMRDMSTLAHELGHSIHYCLSSGHSSFTYDASLPLAETASIFSEMLLSQRMLKTKPEAVRSLWFLQLDDIYASVIRQAGFVDFERKAHDMIGQGKTVTELCDVYLEDLKKQLGPNIEIDPLHAYEWAYVPHIFKSPFYCYAYAFGNLLVLGLWSKFQLEGPSFVPKMEQMLMVGGSQSPYDTAMSVGIDITQHEFWRGAFKVVEQMLEQVEKAY